MRLVVSVIVAWSSLVGFAAFAEEIKIGDPVAAAVQQITVSIKTSCSVFEGRRNSNDDDRENFVRCEGLEKESMLNKMSNRLPKWVILSIDAKDALVSRLLAGNSIPQEEFIAAYGVGREGGFSFGTEIFVVAVKK